MNKSEESEGPWIFFTLTQDARMLYAYSFAFPLDTRGYPLTHHFHQINLQL